MATHAAFTTIDEAITHNLTLALLGLEHARMNGKDVKPRYIGLHRPARGAGCPAAGRCARRVRPRRRTARAQATASRSNRLHTRWLAA